MGVRFSHSLEELLGHNISHALLRAAEARIFPVIHKVVSVVEGDLFARFDVAPGDDPNVAAFPLHFAIRRATMIDKTSRIPIHVTIQILPIIERKDILIVSLASPRRFLLVNLLAEILDHTGALRNVRSRESTCSMDFGFSKNQPIGFEIFRFLEFQIHTLAQMLPSALGFAPAAA